MVALVAFVVAVAGHTAERPALLVAGLAGLLPLAAKVLALPRRGRDAFVLTAVAAGLGLAVFAGAHNGDAATPDRLVPAACVAGVPR